MDQRTLEPEPFCQAEGTPPPPSWGPAADWEPATRLFFTTPGFPIHPHFKTEFSERPIGGGGRVQLFSRFPSLSRLDPKLVSQRKIYVSMFSFFLYFSKGCCAGIAHSFPVIQTSHHNPSDKQCNVMGILGGLPPVSKPPSKIIIYLFPVHYFPRKWNPRVFFLLGGVIVFSHFSCLFFRNTWRRYPT